MAAAIVCDGCRVLLYIKGDPHSDEGRELAVQGERVNIRTASSLPLGQFHWCERCAKIALQAVSAAQLARVAGGHREC